MKLAICSDLHLEFQDINIQNTEGADVLILAGDILVADDLHNHPEMNYGMYSNTDLKQLGARQLSAHRFRDFLKRVSFQFPHVVYIAGNHEFYHGKWKATLQYLRDETSKFPNIHFLEKDTWEHGDITFIGATLWTDCNKGDPITLHSLTGMLNDYRVIRNDEHGYTKLRPAHAMYRHQQTVAYIKQVVDAKPDGKFVMVGHHAPSFQSIHDDYKGDWTMNGGYASELSELILDRPQLKLWVHGHMHNQFDYTIGDTRIVCNPRGYAGHDRQADLFELKFVEV